MAQAKTYWAIHSLNHKQNHNMRLSEHTATWLTVLMLVIFAAGTLVNLGNTAFWEDEGETVQLGKSILNTGLPSAFDGRSLFIQEPGNYHPVTFVRHNLPLLQYYWAAFALYLNKGVADTGAVRLPFALMALSGVVFSLIVFRRLGFSRFTIFLYLFLTSTSVQLYLYYRQVRHYALQPLLVTGILITYLFLDRPKSRYLFIIFSVLMYLAHYPGFFGIYAGLTVHLIISLLFNQKSRLRPFIISSLTVAAMTLPVFIYFRHFRQVPGNNFFANLAAYIYDYNYHSYAKILAVSAAAILLSGFRKKGLLPRFWTIKYSSVSLLSTLIIIYWLVLSTGRHNARYLSDMYPLMMLLVAYGWNEMLKKLKIAKWKWLSLPIFIWLMSVSHPRLFPHIKEFYQELNSTYLGPIEGIVNTITLSPPGPINAYNSQRPDLLIATGFEEHALYAYLNSQFLSVRADDELYKYGNRLPDWLIPRLGEEHPEYFQYFLERGNYQKIVTAYCDLRYQQTYLVRTHQFQTVTDCPNTPLTLYKLITN